MPTVQVVGEFCRTSFSWTPTNVPTLCKMQPHSHCVLRGLDSAVLGVRDCSSLGDLGRLPPMIHARHPDVAAQLIGHLEGHPETRCFRKQLPRTVDGVMGNHQRGEP